MTDWYLTFSQPQPCTIEAYERALATVAGPVTTTRDPWSGNPRDFYARGITLIAQRGAIRVVLRISESARAPDDPDPILGDGFSIALETPSASFATLLVTWHAVRDELAKLGCVDRTVELAHEAEQRAAASPPVVPVAAPEPTPAPRPRPSPRTKPRKPPRTVATAKALAKPRVTFGGGVLEAAPGLDLDGLRALIDSGDYRAATKVVLIHNTIGDPGLAYLARSGGFPSVTVLDLQDANITDKGVHVLAHEAIGLDLLESIDLGDVPGERDGVSDRGVDELAHSSRLPALRTIVRGKEYRMHGREEREVIAIRRDDGRIVESIVDHTIWP